jgi:hypothetical protein
VTKLDLAVMKLDWAMIKFDLAVMKFDLVVLKFDLAVLKFDLAVMKFDPAVMKFDLAVLKFDLAVLKFAFVVLKFDLAVLKFDLAVESSTNRGVSAPPSQRSQPMAFEEKTRVLPAGGQAPAPELLRELVNTMVQDALRAEFDRFLGAAPYERTPARRGHRNGSYPRTLQTRVGALVLDVPRDRAGLFRASLFAKYERSWRERRLSDTPYPALLVDAHIEQVRREGHVRATPAWIPRVTWERRVASPTAQSTWSSNHTSDRSSEGCLGAGPAVAASKAVHRVRV